MSNTSVLQVRMDRDSRQRAEEVYRSLGMTLADAVRMLVAQTIIEQALPFRPTLTVRTVPPPRTARGILSAYARKDIPIDELMHLEKESIQQEAERSHE